MASTVFTVLHERSTSLATLGLERVLDSQTFVSGASFSVSSQQDDPAGDTGFTAQRRPAALGLKLIGVRPGATQYLQPPTPVPTPPPATETPQPTPTTAIAQAAYVAAATPTPLVDAPAAGTASTMPGGNASRYFITGYIATGERTATGTIPHYGVVAVDPNVIPLGATVYIQGLGTFHAEDTGGAIKGNRVDVFVSSEAQAYALTGYRLVSWTR